MVIIDEPLNVDFKVPELIFELIEHSNIIKYNIKSEKGIFFEISEYDESMYHHLFKSDMDRWYFVDFLKNNMVLTYNIKNNMIFTGNKKHDDNLIFNYGSVLEVIKFKEKYYLIEVKSPHEISNLELRKYVGYLKEFNKLNKLTPLMLGV